MKFGEVTNRESAVSKNKGQFSKISPTTIGTLKKLIVSFLPPANDKSSTEPTVAPFKAGIILSGLVPSKQLTKRLFDDEGFQKRHNLMKAVDAINQNSAKIRFDSQA